MQAQQSAAMKAITVRNVPDALYGRLVRLAEKSRRSLQQQVLVLLESAPNPDAAPLERARAIREALAGRKLGDTVREVRAERQR
jgi:plasmid stability protein